MEEACNLEFDVTLVGLELRDAGVFFRAPQQGIGDHFGVFDRVIVGRCFGRGSRVEAELDFPVVVARKHARPDKLADSSMGR